MLIYSENKELQPLLIIICKARWPLFVLRVFYNVFLENNFQNCHYNWCKFKVSTKRGHHLGVGITHSVKFYKHIENLFKKIKFLNLDFFLFWKVTMSTQGSIPIYSVRTKGTRIYVVRGGDVNDFKIYEYFIFQKRRNILIWLWPTYHFMLPK